MNTTHHGNTVLLTQFGAFYREVIRLKQLATSDLRGAGAEQNGVASQEQMPATITVWQRLLSILEHQAHAPGPGAWEYGAEVYREAQYVMAALADETFLRLDWEGKAAWRTNLLESRLFASHVAGELFFQKLEHLLYLRDPAYTDLATVYLMALALGFRGKFWGSDDQGQIEHYRRQLFAFITHRQPGRFDATWRLFPQAYAYTLDSQRSQLLPAPRLWLLAVAGLVLVLGAISHAVWGHVTADVYNVLNRIQ